MVTMHRTFLWIGRERMALYKVIFLGMKVAGPEEETRLIQGLQKRFNLTRERAESLLQRVPIVVKKGILKEEMERYVKAFEEIGGRVRVEEEPSLDFAEVSPETRPPSRPKPESQAYVGPTVTCPQCGLEQPETDECIKCGIIISKYFQYQQMAHSLGGKIREITTEEEKVSWESGEGFVGAFIETTQESLFSPTKFFRKVAEGEGYWAPLIYGVIAGIIGTFGSILWQWLFMAHYIPIPGPFTAIPLGFILTVLLIAMPFLIALSIFIGSVINHVCLMIVGGNKKGFKATFRAVSYAWSGYLFGIIPVVGSTIGAIYSLVLIILGIREGHRITTGKAVLAALLPVIVIVGLCILAVILVPLFLGSMRFFGGGVGV